MTSFQKHFCDLLKARFPFLSISTWEEERILAVMNEAVQDVALIRTPRQLWTWRLTTGLTCEGQNTREETKNPLKALEFIENHPEPSLFVLLDFHIFFGGGGKLPDFQVIRKIRDISPALKMRPKNVVFVSPSLSLPTELQKEVTIVDFELPTVGEIRGVLDELIAANQRSGKITVNLKGDDAERLAKAAQGLTLQEAENAFAHAMVQDGVLDVNDVSVVLQEKAQIIKKAGLLEYIESDATLGDVGGLENLKRWLNKREQGWLDAAQRYGLPTPKGVLITGVPGCGKSLVAKSVSSMWRMPLLRLDIGKIFSGVIGSSEENMRTAIRTAEAIAPCVLWIDEIEKGFSGTGASGDSGTSTRIFGTFLTWMQEKKKPVFVVATANNISSLPAEFLRKGRFDEIFFVDLPTSAERVEILHLHLKKRLKDPVAVGNFRLGPDEVRELAQSTEGFSGAELEDVVINGLFEAFSESRALSLADLRRAIKNAVPLSVTQAEQIRGIREWADVRAIAATPREARTGYETGPETPAPGAQDEGADVRSSRGGRTIDF